jgi:hypothetical protein
VTSITLALSTRPVNQALAVLADSRGVALSMTALAARENNAWSWGLLGKALGAPVAGLWPGGR